jgi:hypothetical protein
MTVLLNTPLLKKLSVACEDMYISMLWITTGEPEKATLRADYRRLLTDPKIDIHARCRIVHAMMGQALRWAEVEAQRAAAIALESKS